MWLRKLLLLFTISVAFSQSIHNAYGLGEIYFNHDASSLAMSSRGIIPSFTEDVSLSNPATWNNLKFAYLAGNYSGNEVSSELGVNGLTGFNSVHFVVPIGTKYAWGFGLRPVFNQQFLLKGSVSEFIVNNDTLSTQHFIDGSGGVSSLYTALRFPLTSTEGLAIEFDILFGSFRKDTKFSFDNRTYHYLQRNIFTGTLYKLFIISNRFNNGKFPANIFFMISGSVRSLKAKQLSFQPFEDVNGNGYFDSSPPSDNPPPSSVPSAETTVYHNIYDPSELGFGLDFKIKNKFHIMVEAHHWKDIGKKPNELFPLKSLYINESNQYSISISKFSPVAAIKMLQKMQYRAGLYYRKDILYTDLSPMNEFGLTVGFGIKFGLTNNQLDFAYKYGMRTGKMISDEIIQQITVGVHLGDLWFVKRR
ncbi:MAG: hypothetical protein IIB95_06525 [Candidatus Marinimicrobia bacterium]|nr:hypothetical protein [Candidatus Neomarinimicrobiota bacterium]MCH7763383.1 hypothetical protein [Candidatus Neomarinimicrobiota bacterium]